ncbi:hypothetical protein CO037_00500 [Candidatus Pacearchaeota archaeon CG_4_9_14_0_2_um_filter_30_8]|nr:MAG: hypothetical protein CO037_00500 [Candidatus Pacearchaeota archaeon CG_4_9_14_0_2_um_filter_30_8]
MFDLTINPIEREVIAYLLNFGWINFSNHLFHPTFIYKLEFVNKVMNVEEFTKKDLKKGDLVKIVLTSDAQKIVIKGQENYISGGEMKNPGRIHPGYRGGSILKKGMLIVPQLGTKVLQSFVKKKRLK